MKQFFKHTLSLSLTLIMLASVSASVSAQSDTNSTIKPQKTSFVGLIEQLKFTDFLFGGRQSVSAVVVKEDGQRVVLNISKNTILVDHATAESVKTKRLEDGQTIFAAHSVDAPITSGEPPSLSPQVVVILNESSTAKIKFDSFDTSGLSSDGSLKITLTEQTKITDKHNKSVELNDALNKELLVFFEELTISSQGDAPQTIPTRVIVVENAR